MIPQEAHNFHLLGHDPSAGWGGGSLVEVRNGHAYVGAIGGSSFDGTEGFTATTSPTRAHHARCGNSRPRPASTCTSCAMSTRTCCM